MAKKSKIVREHKLIKNVKKSAMGSLIDINFPYQLAFVTPGISPFKAISLKDNLDNLNLLIIPLGLPVLKHLFLMRIRLDDLGNLSSFAIADILSSYEEFGLLITAFSSALRGAYFLTFFISLCSRTIFDFFAIMQPHQSYF